jgi:hypothetical protein
MNEKLVNCADPLGSELLKLSVFYQLSFVLVECRKSSRINTTLAVNGLTPLLIARLDHQDAIARLNLLKLIKVKFSNSSLSCLDFYHCTEE